MLGLTEYTDPTTRGSYRKHPIPVTNANPYADSPLLPVKHEIKGTDSNVSRFVNVCLLERLEEGTQSVILFKDVKVLDSTGREPFPGDVLIRGERIVKVSAKINEDKIKGTDSNVSRFVNVCLLERLEEGTQSVILFKDVKVLDSTGREPFPGDVLIRGERIVKVSAKINEDKVKETDPQVHIIEGKGRTLMSGLCDAHTHLSWNNSPDLEGLGHLPPEEHTIFAIRAARTYLDYGYTMCFGAASARARLDCVLRDAINAGDIAGPRYLANEQEIARRDGALIESISSFADGPEEMRIAVLKAVALGADQVKLSMSGESLTEKIMSDENFFTDEETKAACEAAHEQGKGVCSHARSMNSVKMSARWGVDVIYHASFTMKRRWTFSNQRRTVITELLTSASDYGCTPEHAIEVTHLPSDRERAFMANQIGYKDELDEAIKSMKAMKARGTKILPGGDYGDLEDFVNLFGYTPMEAIIAATALGGDLFMRPHELGKVLPGYYADLIVRVLYSATHMGLNDNVIPVG
ncbi:hypothetical protein DACRYDRAFT_107645 [Dacryopinax primogenitus]|uniref:Amidohydrolase-related domain-containing protein n=1 Tax=Dacryopinax primogenitus (strain DJM 731) TaxID=1858805 RepID=M5FVQ5_DACPD|nr:uncharacterized protein DACRYDRAFT_107645 [Dacryopinax primogenitus]EJU01911.1 hypothetical protein DACRYDRAFT_107645 [Dacryopinax primogenitus]